MTPVPPNDKQTTPPLRGLSVMSSPPVWMEKTQIVSSRKEGRTMSWYEVLLTLAASTVLGNLTFVVVALWRAGR